jgi:biopolymer transport protein ExbD
MLTTTFRPTEAVQVDTPNSISEKITPEKNVITVLISKDDKVFFNMDNGSDSSMHVRRKLLEGIAAHYQLKFTPEQITKFEGMASFGMPIKDLGAWIDASDPKEKEKMQTGIPIDSLDNQLEMWVLYARQASANAEAAIKGDGASDYKTVKKVLDVFQKVKINRFNLTTNLETVEVKLENK